MTELVETYVATGNIIKNITIVVLAIPAIIIAREVAKMDGEKDDGREENKMNITTFAIFSIMLIGMCFILAGGVKECYISNYKENFKDNTKKELISKKIEKELDELELATYREHFTYFDWRVGNYYLNPYEGFGDCYDIRDEKKCMAFIKNVVSNVKHRAVSLRKIKNL